MAVAKAPSADVRGLEEENDTFFTSEPFDQIDNNLFSGDDTLTEILDIKLSEEDNLTVPKETLETPSSIDILKETIKNLKSVPLPPPGDGDNVPNANLVLEGRILESLKSSKAAQQKYYMVRSEIEKAVSRARLAKLEDASLSMTLKLIGGSALTIGSVVVVATAVYFGAGPFLTWLFSSGKILTAAGQNLLISLVEKSFYTNVSLLTGLRQNLTGLQINSEFYQATWDIINSYLTDKGKNILQLESADWTDITQLVTQGVANKEKILETIEYIKNFQVQLLSMILSSQDITKVGKSSGKLITGIKNIRQIVSTFDIDKLVNLLAEFGEVGTDLFTLAGKSNFIFKTAQSIFECSTSTSANKLQRLLAKLPLDTLVDSEYIKGSMFNYLYKGVDKLLTEGSILTFRVAFPIEYEDLGRPLKAGELPQEKKYFYFITGTDMRKNITGAIINTASNQSKAVVNMGVDALFGKELPEIKKKAAAADDDDKSPKTLRIRQLLKEKKSIKEIEEIISAEFPIITPPEDLTLYPTDDFITRFTKEFKQGMRNIKELYKKSDGFLFTTSVSAFITMSMGVFFDYSTKPSSFSQEYTLGRFRFYLFPIIAVLNNILDLKVFRNLPNHLNPMVDEITRIIKTLTREILRYLFSFVSVVGQKVAEGTVYTLEKIGLSNKSIVIQYGEIMIKGLFEILGAIGKGVTFLATDVLMVGVDREAKTVIRNSAFIMKDISLDSIWTYLNTWNKYYNSLVSGIVSVKGWLGLSTTHLHEFGRMILEQNSMHVMKTGVDIIVEQKDCDFSNYASNTVFGYTERSWKYMSKFFGLLGDVGSAALLGIPMANTRESKCYKPTKATISLGEDMVVTITDETLAEELNEASEKYRAVYNLYFAAVSEGIDPATFDSTPEFEDFYKRLGVGITDTISLNDVKSLYASVVGAPGLSLDQDLFTIFKTEIFHAWSANVDESRITAWLANNPGKSKDDFLKQEFEKTFPQLIQYDKANRIQLDATLSDYGLHPEQIQEVNKKMFDRVSDSYTEQLRLYAQTIYVNNSKYETNFAYTFTYNGEDKTLLFIENAPPGLSSQISYLDLDNLPEELRDQKDELLSMQQLGYRLQYIDHKKMSAADIEQNLDVLKNSGFQFEKKDLGENTDFMDKWRDHVNETTPTLQPKVKFLSRFDNPSDIQNIYRGGKMKGTSIFMDIKGVLNIFAAYRDAEYMAFTEEELTAARQWFAQTYITEDRREEFLRKIRTLPDVSKTIAQLGRAQKRTEKSMVKAYKSMRRNIFASIPGIFNTIDLNAIHSFANPNPDMPTTLLHSLLGNSTVPRLAQTTDQPQINYSPWILEQFTNLTNSSDKTAALWYMLLSADDPTFQAEISRILALPPSVVNDPRFMKFFKDALNSETPSLQPLKIGDHILSTQKLTDLNDFIQSQKNKLIGKDSQDQNGVYQPMPYIAKKLDDVKRDPSKALPINVIANNNNQNPLTNLVFLQHFFQEQERLVNAAGGDFSKLPHKIRSDPEKSIRNFFGLNEAYQATQTAGNAPVVGGYDQIFDMITNNLGPTNFQDIGDNNECVRTMLNFREVKDRYVYTLGAGEEQRLFTFLNTWLPKISKCMSKLIQHLQNSNLKRGEELFIDIAHFNTMSSWLQNEWVNTIPRKKMTKEEIQDKWIELTGGALHIPLGPIESQAAIQNHDSTLSIFADYTEARDQDYVDTILEDIRNNFALAFPSDTAFFTDTSQGLQGAPQGLQQTSGLTSGQATASGAGAAQAQAQAQSGPTSARAQQTAQTTTTTTAQQQQSGSQLATQNALETASNALDTVISETISNIIASIQSLLNTLTSITSQLSSAFGGTPRNVAAGRGRGDSLSGLGTGRRTDERQEPMEDIQELCFKYRDHYVISGKDKIKITKPQGLPPHVTESFLNRCPLNSAAALALEYYLSILEKAYLTITLVVLPLFVLTLITCTVGPLRFSPWCIVLSNYLSGFIWNTVYFFTTAFTWVQKVDEYYSKEINRMKLANGQALHEQFDMQKYFLTMPNNTPDEQSNLTKDMTSVMMVVSSEFAFESIKSYLRNFVSILSRTLSVVPLMGQLLQMFLPLVSSIEAILTLKQSKNSLYGLTGAEYNIKGRWIPKSRTHQVAGQAKVAMKQTAITLNWAPFGVELALELGRLANPLTTIQAVYRLKNMNSWQSFTDGSTNNTPQILGDYNTQDIAFTAEYGDVGSIAQGNINPWEVLGRFLQRMIQVDQNFITTITKAFETNYNDNVYKEILKAKPNSVTQCKNKLRTSGRTDFDFEVTITVFSVNGNIESSETRQFQGSFPSIQQQLPRFNDVNNEFLTSLNGTSDFQKIESFFNNRNLYDTEIRDSSGIVFGPGTWNTQDFDPCALEKGGRVPLKIEVKRKLGVVEQEQRKPTGGKKSIEIQFNPGDLEPLKQFYNTDLGDGARQVDKYYTDKSGDTKFVLPTETLTNKSDSVLQNKDPKNLYGIAVENQPNDPDGRTMWAGYQGNLTAFKNTLRDNTKSRTSKDPLDFFNEDVLPPVIDPNRFNSQAFEKDPSGKITGIAKGTSFTSSLTNDYVQLDGFESIEKSGYFYGYNKYPANPIWLLRRDVEAFQALNPNLTFDEAKVQFADRYNTVLMDANKPPSRKVPGRTGNNIDITNWFEYTFIFSSAKNHPYITIDNRTVRFEVKLQSDTLTDGDVLAFNDTKDNQDKIKESQAPYALE